MDVSSAQKAVLQPSQSVADGTPKVHGYDFNGGVNYEKLFDSYATTGFQATHLSAAIDEINAMLNERGVDVKLEEGLDPCFPYPAGRKRKALTLFLGYTSNLVSSGLRDIFRFLVQHDLVDCVVTSAGGVEEDFIKCMKPTYIGSFRMTGTTLREKGLNRAGNLLIPNENYCAFEEWLMPILDECLKEQQEQGVLWTPSKLIDRLGREINDETSICYWAHRNRIPVFCPALTDGSLGDMLYFHSVANAPGLRLDIVEDVRHINTMAVKSFKTGVIILGGGFVKHHINNANLMRNGSDYTVYVNTGQEFDGSDSGAEPDEAVSWGKVKGTTRAVKVTADATLVFPIIAAKCFAKRVVTPAVKSVEPASLTKGSAALSTIEDLRVPVGHRQSTTVTFTSDDFAESAVSWQDGCAIPGAVGSLVEARVVFVGAQTKRGAVVVKKAKREIHVKLDGEGDDGPSSRLLNDYDAGDSVYFAFPNRSDEVAILLERLGLLGTAADRSFTFSTVVGGDGGIPHVPNPCSARYLLTNCLDIRRSPGRPLLRALVEHCANASERRRLLELCSAQGTDEFTRFVRKAGLSLVDVLLAFPSCRPPIECLMDLLPRLMPRAYSIANYKNGWRDRLRFVYSLLETPAGDGVRFARYGACSGWMRSLRVGDVVRIALKEPSKFRLPPILQPELDITRCPLILIGPGTGVAPFISFLQKIRMALKKMGPDVPPVKRYLFYGSSDLSEEFLFEDELKQLKEAGVLTDLIVCESRPKTPTADRPKYVYDALKKRCYNVAELLVGEKHDPPPLIFSCGDVKNMSKQLWACLADICEECLGLFRPEIVAFLQRLRTSERLIEDVWS